MASARADVASGQAALVSRLDALLQKQQAALEAAASAAKALAAIQDLQGQQAKALQSLEKAVQSQLYAIKVAGWAGGREPHPAGRLCAQRAVSPAAPLAAWLTGAAALCTTPPHPTPAQVATSQNVITLGQALMLWKRARRDRALAAKVSLLANVPCTMAPTADNEFTLDNGNNGARGRRIGGWSGVACEPGACRDGLGVVQGHVEQRPSLAICLHARAGSVGTARDRSIGLNNRVVGGLLVNTWRTRPGR